MSIYKDSNFIWLQLIFKQKPCFLGPIEQETSWMTLMYKVYTFWEGRKKVEAISQLFFDTSKKKIAGTKLAEFYTQDKYPLWKL